MAMTMMVQVVIITTVIAFSSLFICALLNGRNVNFKGKKNKRKEQKKTQIKDKAR
jgi:hypothetical protein